MICCSLASISACLELAEQVLLFIIVGSKFLLILVGVPFGWRGTVNVTQNSYEALCYFPLLIGVLDN
jgi:hypothetical protein